MTCPACGNNTGTNDVYCQACGQQLQEGNRQFSQVIETTEENEAVSVCENCGSGLTAGQLYCTVCGVEAGG